MVCDFSYSKVNFIFVRRICVSIMMGNTMYVMGRGLIVIRIPFSIIDVVEHCVRVSNLFVGALVLLLLLK